MKKKTILISLLATISLAMTQSCNIDTFTPAEIVEPVQEAGKTITITATLEAQDTKTQMVDGKSYSKVVWTAGDKIRVFNASNKSGAVFTLNSECDGKSSGTFTGTISGDGPYYAFYPENLATSLSNSTYLNFNMPGTQTYSEGSFPEEANIAVAYGNDKNNLKFKNVCGILCLSVTGNDDVSKIVVTTNGDETINGSSRINMTYDDGAPEIDYYLPQSESERSITLNCNEVSLSSTPTKFYVVVPAGLLSEGFVVEVFDDNGCSMIKTARQSDNNKINRSAITTMPSFAYTATYNSAIHNSDYGIYVDANAGSTSSTAAKYSDGGQYSLSSAYDNTDKRTYCSFRIQNWDEGYAVTFSKIPTSLNVGDTFNMNVSVLGDANYYSPSKNSLSTKVIRKIGDKVWLYDEDKTCYVLTLQ